MHPTNLYRRLPNQLQPLAERLWAALPAATTGADIREQFVAEMFPDRTTYEAYTAEFDEVVAPILADAEAEYERRVGDTRLAAMGTATARDVYALVRHERPETVVETGVCNGASTLAMLAALDANDAGHCHSIDYPLRADEDLDAFHEVTSAGTGAATIPPDADPGWLIPEDLRSRWSLTLGKSQEELPGVLTGVGAVDLFVHDSEHATPTMHCEMDLAYHHLAADGLLLVDDIDWTDAFETFVDVRDPAHHGRMSPTVGYIRP
ncbi:class I SAM-dependent methyltransferase [Haloarcula sp. JP-L23]|uniref:class I SAM-dependent methyltransferase n=1 Tax=Haloarcula sp. JP-L23 TaxID=2716717 RepID=UPI00140EE51D|nr:class I SAM-dependent methyltransferase [Haloarcula sp. JP-L23]